MLGIISLFVNCCHIHRSTVLFGYLAFDFGRDIFDQKPCVLISLTSYMMGITSRIAWGSPVYSKSVLNNEISVCNWYYHTKGNPSYITMYPCLDLAVSLSKDFYWYQLLSKSASTYTSRYFPVLGFNIVPLSQVPFRYCPNHWSSCAWSLSGADVNIAH